MKRWIAVAMLVGLTLGCATTPMQKWGTAKRTATVALESVTIYSQAGYLELEDAETIDVLVEVVDVALERAREYAKTGEIDLMEAALETAYRALDRIEIYLAEQ